MAKFDDLSTELVERIVAILGKQSKPYGHRKNLAALARLCRVSKRLCDVARLELYSVASFASCYAMTDYFERSGISKVPNNTLKRIFIGPDEEDSFFMLDEAAELFAPHCKGVKYLEIYICWMDGNMLDNKPALYLPLFRVIDPKSILHDPGFSPNDMANCGHRPPVLPLSTLVAAFSSYTRLTYLRLPMIDFDRLEKPEVDILGRLPLEYLCLDWPTSLTCAKVCALLEALPKLREGGLVIASRPGRLELELGMIGQTDQAFLRQNRGLSISALEKYLEKQGQGGLLVKVNWQGPIQAEELDEGEEWHSKSDQWYDAIRAEQFKL